MNKFLDLRLSRFVPVGLIALAIAMLLAPAPASATPYVLNLVQQGSNVVATGSGEFDLSGLTYYGAGPNSSGGLVIPWDANIFTSGSIYWAAYIGPVMPYGFTGPTSIGSSNGAYTPQGSGDYVGINVEAGLLAVPIGYVSGTALSSSATWDNASFFSLGVKPGTYVWSWGSAADQSFTLDIVKPVGVAEPAELGMFGLGLLLIGGFVGLRRRAA